MNIIVNHITEGVEQFTIITDIEQIIQHHDNRNIYDGRITNYVKTRFDTFEYWRFAGC